MSIGSKQKRLRRPGGKVLTYERTCKEDRPLILD